MSQQIRGQGGHLVFPIGPKNTNLVEDVEIYLPVKVSSNSVQRFQRRSRKCEKLTTTDDGQHMITIVHLSLRLRCTKKTKKRNAKNRKQNSEKRNETKEKETNRERKNVKKRNEIKRKKIPNQEEWYQNIRLEAFVFFFRYFSHCFLFGSFFRFFFYVSQFTGTMYLQSWHIFILLLRGMLHTDIQDKFTLLGYSVSPRLWTYRIRSSPIHSTSLISSEVDCMGLDTLTPRVLGVSSFVNMQDTPTPRCHLVCKHAGYAHSSVSPRLWTCRIRSLLGVTSFVNMQDTLTPRCHLVCEHAGYAHSPGTWCHLVCVLRGIATASTWTLVILSCPFSTLPLNYVFPLPRETNPLYRTVKMYTLYMFTYYP